VLTDHKIIGKQYLLLSLVFLGIGGALAMLMRWQLAWPGAPVPLIGNLIPSFREAGGIVTPEGYASIFSQHGTIMIFFVVIPILVGGFGNFLIPLMIGARDMAFPRLNALSFYVHALGGAVIFASFFVPGGAGASGWTAYPPLSVIMTSGQDYWIVSLLLAGTASILTSINFIATIFSRRAPGMFFHRLPLTVWSLLVTAFIILFATPALSVSLILLMCDRHVGTNFFTPAGQVITGVPMPRAGGGQPLLYQHLFWFYSHPAVYIMILPAMGMISDILPVFSRKPIFGYRAVAYASVAIGLMGFLVWGHHMFQSGMNPLLATTFMVSTFAISVPSGIKTFNWIATIWRGSLRFDSPMLYACAFISMFVIGGLSGIFLASTPVDMYMHDTYFVVAHIHYVLFGGSLFGIFAGIHYWFPKMFGRTLSEPLARVHFWLTFLAYNCTFFPMHILGVGGMMRRLYDPTVYTHLQKLQPWNVFITLSAYALGAAQLIFVINLLASIWGTRGRGARLLGRVTAVIAALSFAPLIDFVCTWCGISAGRFSVMGITFGAAAVSLPLSMLAAAAIARYLYRTTVFSASPADANPWQANTLEWQTASPAPLNNFETIPTVHHGPYEYSSPHDVTSDYLPQNSRLDAAPHLAETGDRNQG
jgi:cytochrome c oxidase subunit I